MSGSLLITAGSIFIGLLVYLHSRRFPPKAQLLCDLWKMVEAQD